MSRFYAKVVVPLSGDGWFQIEADLPDLAAVQADEMAVVRSALRQAFEFALGLEDAQAVEEHELEAPVADEQPRCARQGCGLSVFPGEKGAVQVGPAWWHTACYRRTVEERVAPEAAKPVEPLEEAAGANGGPVPRRAPEPEPADPDRVERARPVPPFEMAKCPECDREFVPSGLKVHMARAHPQERRCAEEDCDTVLSRYNKGNRCGQHEGLRVG